MHTGLIYEDTIRNDGGTYVLNENGSLEFANHKSGFMVSIGQERAIALDDFGSPDIFEFIGDKYAFLTWPNMFFGTWIHDGIVYLDISTHTHDLDCAIAIANRHGELAIWDCETNTSISVNPADYVLA